MAGDSEPFDIPFPHWHDEVLKERDRMIDSQEESFVDWEVAKKQLRKELESD